MANLSAQLSVYRRYTEIDLQINEAGSLAIQEAA